MMITDGAPRANDIVFGGFKILWKEDVIVTLRSFDEQARIAFDRKSFLGSVFVHDQHI